MFLEDVLEMSYYALEENSRYARKLGRAAMNVLDNLETELELMDIKTGNMIANPKTPDQSLNIKQLFHRYEGQKILKLVTNIGQIGNGVY